MKQYSVILSTLLALLLFFNASLNTVQAQEKPAKRLMLLTEDKNAIANQYIVVLSDEFFPSFIKSAAYKKLKTREQKAEGLQSYTAQLRRKLIPMLKQHKIDQKAIKKVISGGLSGFVATLSKGQLEAILKLKFVRWVEQDGHYKIVYKKPVLVKIPKQKPDWGVALVGSGNGQSLENIAFVIDTGIDQDHPDLNVNRSLSASMIVAEPGKDDKNGHGTHCAGIIGAKDNFWGTKGVAAGAQVVGVKVLDRTGGGSWGDLIDGISYTTAVGNRGDVANMSLGAPGNHFTVSWLIRYGLSFRGIYTTIAAGNSNMHAGGYMPARVNGNRIFTVSNMDQNKRIVASSNYGNSPVDYAAPGTDIYSTYKDGGYATKSGTSMAAPHVAGILLINRGVIRTKGTVIYDKDPIKDKIASVN